MQHDGSFTLSKVKETAAVKENRKPSWLAVQVDT